MWCAARLNNIDAVGTNDNVETGNSKVWPI